MNKSLVIVNSRVLNLRVILDAMSSFGVKSILRRDIATQDCWFQNNEEVCNYLSSRSHCRMSYSNLDPAKIDRNRLTKDGLVIKGCMSKHKFEYVPNSNDVFNKEYLCDCQECINFNFHSCLKEVGDVENMNETQESEHYDDCLMVDENEKGLKIFDFTDVPSFVAVVTFSLSEPIYIIKVTEKGKVTEKMSDNYGHNIMEGELYFRGNYLQLVRSKKISNKQFKIIEKDVIISPEEVLKHLLTYKKILQWLLTIIWL